MKVYPVVHVHETRVLEEVEKACRHDVAGVFLIDHEADDARLLRAVEDVTQAHPGLFVGVNFIRRPWAAALDHLRSAFGDDPPVRAVWADVIDHDAPPNLGAHGILHFGGVAFKYQVPVPLGDLAAHGAAARGLVDVATTSGAATGEAADPARILALRAGLGDVPLALASGVTPDNAAQYQGLVEHVLVASGIAGPQGIDESRLARLMTALG